MPYRIGGLDPLEAREALDALAAARSVEDVNAAVDLIPALSTPGMFAILHANRYKRWDSDAELAIFEFHYSTLLYILLLRWFLEVAAGVQARGVESASDEDARNMSSPFLPPFWAALRDSLGDLAPSRSWLVRDPARDADGLQEDLCTLIGRDVVLPTYEPTVGAWWVAVIVICAACGRPRLDIRAYAVDLVAAPHLSQPLKHGRLSNTACPACGEVCAIPHGIWAMEQPGVEDTLAAVSCIWRLAPNTFCFQPPQGVTRSEERDLIIEARSDELLQRIQWPEPRGDGRLILVAAYSLDELLRWLEISTTEVDDTAEMHEPAQVNEAYEVTVPAVMFVLAQELSRKVASGMTSLHLAMDTARKSAPKDGSEWPLVVPGNPHEWRMAPLTHLIYCLIAEGVAQKRSEPPDLIAFIVAQTASSLIAMGEDALAEAALERAEDYLAQLPPDNDGGYVRQRVLEVRVDLLHSLSRFNEANAIRRETAERSALPAEGFTENYHAAALASQQALALYSEGRLGEALPAFENCIADAQTMLEELTPEERLADEGRRERSVMHLLSGNLANLGVMLKEAADDMTVVLKIGDPSLSDEERIKLIRAANSSRAEAEARLARVQAASSIFEKFCGEEIEVGPLTAEAESLLRRALALSTTAESWKFAGIQARRLMELLQEAGDSKGAEEFAELTVRHATMAGDHPNAALALSFLAERELARGNGPETLQHLEACALEWIRFKVGLGHHPQQLAVDKLATTAFLASATGGDPLRAVMIAENLRAAHTAISLTLGSPYQLGTEPPPQAVAEVLANREQLRLYAAENPDDPDTEVRLRAIEAELHDVRSTLAMRDPRFSRWADATHVALATPESMTRRLAQLGPGSLWLGALLTHDTLWTWAVDTTGATLVTSHARPEHWSTEVSGSGLGVEDTWSESLLAELSTALLSAHATCINALTTAGTLVISIDDSVGRVPFAALPWAGKRLCHYARIATVQGFGMFETSLSRPQLQFRSFALIGAPERTDGLPLPSAEEELTAIAALLKDLGRDVHVTKGTAATATALADAAPSHDVIHIACHATERDPTAQTSHLKLSPDIIRHDSGDVSEDLIATGIAIRRGALVDIAACSTGRTQESGGPLLGGLVPAFLLAGAGCVIASLWPIEDDLSVEFQLEFYRNLVSGTRPVAALAATQRSCDQGELGSHMRYPEIWAAFVAYGGW